MSVTMTKSLRIPRETLKEIEQEFRDRVFSSVANELLVEGVKMRRCPGVIFMSGATGTRTARIACTGNDVWSIVASYKRMKGDWNRLRKSYSWHSKEQLRAALNYYTW